MEHRFLGGVDPYNFDWVAWATEKYGANRDWSILLRDDIASYNAWLHDSANINDLES